jgi:hypothetical protein
MPPLFVNKPSKTALPRKIFNFFFIEKQGVTDFFDKNIKCLLHFDEKFRIFAWSG